MPLGRIAYVQFSDAPDARSDDLLDETMNRRVMPGNGGFELERFASTLLLERGWEGLVSIEVLSRDLGRLPVAEVRRLAYESTSPILGVEPYVSGIPPIDGPPSTARVWPLI